jgi:hypothetical protein
VRKFLKKPSPKSELLTSKDSGNKRTTEKTNRGIIIRKGTRRNFIRRWGMKPRRDH